jgi:hypothetical protein
MFFSTSALAIAKPDAAATTADIRYFDLIFILSPRVIGLK